MKIKTLPQEVINKIAAGEVVERPASVIKELVENAIDAGATSIRVAVFGGGQKSIEVEDDGVGMSADDALVSLQRHATSKIEDDRDLYNLSTLGFRGEALAAISAVSKFHMTTKRQEDAEGTVIYFEDTVNQSVGPSKVGTHIRIDELFYNVPARKKFMKSVQTETRYNTTLITQFALLYHNIEFRYESEGRLLLHYQQQEDWKNRVDDVLGTDIAKHLVSVEQGMTDMQVTGFIAKPAIHRPNRKSQYIFVNGRAIDDHIVSSAVRDAFRNYIPPKDYPVFVLKLTVPKDFVDVNVHPRKTEVKFSDSQIIYRLVYRAAKNILQSELDNFSFSSSTIQNNTATHFKPTTQTTSSSFSFQAPSTQASVPFQTRGGQSFVTQREDMSDIGQPEPAQQKKQWKLLGQVNNSYLIGYAEDNFYVIDQHAAAERVIFDRIMANVQAPKIQSLLLPITLELSGREVDILSENLESLRSIGFDIDVFGVNTFIVQGIPSQIRDQDIQEVMMGIIDDLSTDEISSMTSLQQKSEVAAKYTACRSAVKFGDPLTLPEQEQLLHDIQVHNVVSCPHGRPAVWKLSWEELARKFQRP